MHSTDKSLEFITISDFWEQWYKSNGEQNIGDSKKQLSDCFKPVSKCFDKVIQLEEVR
jgi:hypothetical protein